MKLKVENGVEWYEDELEDDLKWSYSINRVIEKATSEYQEIVLVDSKRFGKASDEPITINVEDIDRKIEERIVGELSYLDGATLVSSTTLSKPLSLTLKNETSVYTEETAKFIHGRGISTSGNIIGA